MLRAIKQSTKTKSENEVNKQDMISYVEEQLEEVELFWQSTHCKEIAEYFLDMTRTNDATRDLESDEVEFELYDFIDELIDDVDRLEELIELCK